METWGAGDSSKQGEMEQPNMKLSGWGHCVSKTRSRLQLMAYCSDGKCR